MTVLLAELDCFSVEQFLEDNPLQFAKQIYFSRERKLQFVELSHRQGLMLF